MCPVNLISAALFISAALRFLNAVDRSHAKAPYMDTSMAGIAVGQALDHGVSLKALEVLFQGAQHNDSIKFFPLLLEYLVSLPSGHWSPAASVLLGAVAWILLLGSTALICSNALRAPLAKLSLVALACTLGFAPASRFLLPFAIHRVLPLACTLSVAVGLSRNKLGWRHLLSGWALCLIATFSFANGFLSMVVLWLMLSLRAAGFLEDVPRASERGMATIKRTLRRVAGWAATHREIVLGAAVLTVGLAMSYYATLDLRHFQIYQDRHQDDFATSKLVEAFASWISSPADLLGDTGQNIFDHLGSDRWLIQALGLLLGSGLALLSLTLSPPGSRPSRRERQGGLVVVALLVGLFVPTTLLLAAHRSGGFDSGRYLCEITLLSLILTSSTWMLRQRHRTRWGPAVEPILIAAVMLSVFSTLPLNFTSGYRKAMRRALPGELRLVEHCLKGQIREEATADLWEHCQLKTVNPGEAAREHFRVMARQKHWRRSLLQ